MPNRRSKRYRGPPAEQGNNRGAKYPTAEQEGSATDEGGWVGAFAFRPRARGTLSTLAEAAAPARASLRIGRADHLERHGRFDDAAKPSCDDSPSATHELQAHRRSRKTPQEDSHCHNRGPEATMVGRPTPPRDRRRDSWRNGLPRSETRPTRSAFGRPSRFPWPSRAACPRLATMATGWGDFTAKSQSL